jgi:long-chain acyl-CoA synthetase
MLPIEKLLPRARRFYGEREAVGDSDGWMTYSELGKRVDALSAAFGRFGLRQGDRVAILDTNSRQYLEAYYAAAQLGLMLVPMNSRLSGPEIEYIINDCQARVLIYAASFTDLVISIRARLTTVETVVRYGDGLNVAGCIAYESAIAEAGPLGAPPLIAPSDIAQIYYTSGTTGEPKGVALTYSNMAHSAVDAIIGLGLTWRDTWMHTAPLFHLVDAWAVWAMPLLGGRQSVLHFDPEKALRFIEQTKSTASGLPPTLLNMMANHPRINDHDISSMRLIMYGGSPMPMGILTNAVAKLPIHFAHAYGITETSGITTLLRTDSPADIIDKAGSAGQSVPNIVVEIHDDYGQPVAAGQIGEVVVSGPRVMNGYWGKQAETDKVLVKGAYYTGDLGRLDENNNLTLIDRKKDMIISGGENVYSAEVENLISTLPGVVEVAVIGIPNATWGEAVHAVIVCDKAAVLNESELIAWCRGRIAGYKIPKSVSFSTEPLPKTGPGKIAKRRLRDRYWQDQPSKI